MRSIPRAIEWTDQRADVGWRSQFIFNLALAKLKCGVELDPAYNIQLHSHDVEIREDLGRCKAFWHGQPARILHFNGWGRQKYLEWRQRFAQVDKPLITAGGGDNYSVFIAALRAWIGRYGTDSLAWSFYGTADGLAARIADADTFPLLATLHYLIRANGCVRVIETGTAQGVSAACLASAVAHREHGRVVTLDLEHSESLWAMLPDDLRNCIEAREVDSLKGLQAAIDAGEQFEAALLDSLHDADHVWAEFQLAAQLVCPGGLILIHDANFVRGTVPEALQRIEAAGYNIVRLWSAASGVREDDHLGLAVIDNRKRKGRRSKGK